MNNIVRIAVHGIIYLIALVVFWIGLGLGLAWEGISLSGLTVSGPTAGSILWLTAGLIALGNTIWLVRYVSGGRSSKG